MVDVARLRAAPDQLAQPPTGTITIVPLGPFLESSSPPRCQPSTSLPLVNRRSPFPSTLSCPAMPQHNAGSSRPKHVRPDPLGPVVREQASQCEADASYSHRLSVLDWSTPRARTTTRSRPRRASLPPPSGWIQSVAHKCSLSPARASGRCPGNNLWTQAGSPARGRPKPRLAKAREGEGPYHPCPS